MKSTDVFKILPENFFVPLSSPNRKTYIDVLSLIYKAAAGGLSYGVDKEFITDEIENFLDERDIYIEDDEKVSDSREKATLVIRKLLEYQWIYDEDSSNYKRIINFHDYSIIMIEALEKISVGERAEYQGNIIAIYSLLKQSNERKEDAGAIIRQVYDSTKTIISSLKTLNANIKKYMDRLTKKMKPEEILDEVFSDYTKDVLDASYHRLLTSEHLSKYRPFIIENLKGKLEDKEFLEFAGRLLVNDKKVDNLDEGIERSIATIHEIVNAIMEIEKIMKDINSKNSRYINAAASRAKFLLNNSKDIIGMSKVILEYTCKKYKDLDLKLSQDYLKEFKDFFNIYSYGYYEEDSLYKSNEGKKSFIPEKIKKNNISKEEREKLRLEFIEMKKSMYTVNKINDIVLNLLKDKESLVGSNLKFEKTLDYVEMIYMKIYGKDSLAKYEIETLDTVVEKNGYSFKDFKIWRKEK